MTLRLAKILTILATLCLLAGCKLAVIVVEGGEVQSTMSGTCLAGTVCIHEVTDTSYAEQFTAVADTGWQFVKWNSGGDFFCEDSTAPTCVLSNALVAGLPGVDAFIATGYTFYIMPVFTEIGAPITNTVAADGKEWAQVELFYNLSWNEISAVCPSGSCVEGGILNGYDMTGWTWASNSDFVDLLNSYGINPPLVTPPNGGEINYLVAPQGWGVQFFNSWNAYPASSLCAQTLEGWLSDTYLTSEYDGGVAEGCPVSTVLLDFVALAPFEDSQAVVSVGAWFYRIP